MAFVVIVVSLVVPDWLWIERAPRPDQATIDALDDVAALALCGAGHASTGSVRIAEDAVGRESQIVPIRSLAETKAGSIDAYCAAQAQGRPSRGALSTIETGILRVRPAISFAGLAKALHAVRVACVLAFVLMLMTVGYGVAAGCVVAFAALWILVAMKDQLYSAAPFGLVLTITPAALYVWASRYGWSLATAGCVAVGIAAGAWSAFAAGLLPRQLPVQVAMLGVFLAAETVRQRTLDSSRHSAWRMSLLAGGFVVGFATLRQWLRLSPEMGDPAITPLRVAAMFPSGVWTFAVCALAFAASAVWFMRSRSLLALVPALLTAAACVMQVDWLMTGITRLDHSSYVTFCVAFMSLVVCGQIVAALDQIWTDSPAGRTT
jgi:hypothetical protein